MSALLALTDSAVEAVKHIVSSSEEASETGGLRLVAEHDKVLDATVEQDKVAFTIADQAAA